MGTATFATVNKELFFEWGSRVQTYPFPAGFSVAETRAREVLDAAKCKKESSLRDCLRFITWLAFEYGSYGTKIYPAESTMAEEYGVSTRTVSRWLQAATGLGILCRVRDADRSRGITAAYEIAPWWEKNWDTWAGPNTVTAVMSPDPGPPPY